MDALRSADTREALEALRDRLADAIEIAKPAELAALARQFADVRLKLDAITSPERSEYDDLATRRDARRAAIPDTSADSG